MKSRKAGGRTKGTPNYATVEERLAPRHARFVAKAVVAAEKQRLDENKVTATRVIEENRRIGFNDPRRFFAANGTLKPITEWTEDMAAAVSKIELVKKNAAAGDGHTDTVVKLWFWNKNPQDAPGRLV
jgi:terminase small subunit-like protein